MRISDPPPSSIRVFYLGRELKTNGRTLTKLGVATDFDVRVLHVVIPPSNQSQRVKTRTAVPPRQKRTGDARKEIVLLDDDDDNNNDDNEKDDDEVVIVDPPPKRSRRVPP